MLSVFDFSSYKDFVSSVLAEKTIVRGFQGQMARAAGCQPSYLSQALRTKVELTPDHGMGIAKFLELSPAELDYFLNLIHYSRASDRALKDLLTKKLHQSRKDQMNLSKRIIAETLKSQDIRFYYSSWIFLAVHMALGIAELTTEEALAQRLGVERSFVLRTLRELQRNGLAEIENGRWKPLKRESHLAADSELTQMNHMNWRMRAVQDIQAGDADGLHYSSVFTLARSDAEKLRKMVMDFIEGTRKVIHSSAEEELFCFSADFFAL